MLLATGAYLIVITYHALPLTMFEFKRIDNNLTTKGGFFSESVIRFLNLQKNIPKNYPELEI